MTAAESQRRVRALRREVLSIRKRTKDLETARLLSVAAEALLGAEDAAARRTHQTFSQTP